MSEELERELRRVLEEVERTHAALLESRERLARVQSIAHLGDWELDLLTKTGRWSDEVCRLYGRDPALGAPAYDDFLGLVHPDDRALVVDSQQRALDSDVAFEHRIVLPNGSLRHLHAVIHCLRSADGTPRRLVGTVMDVSARSNAEESVRLSEQRLFQFLESLPVGIFMMLASGTPYYANRVAQEILGRGVAPTATPDTLAEVYNVFVAGTSERYPAARMPIVKALGGESSIVDDMEIEVAGRRIALVVQGAPIHGADRRIEYAVSVFQDITEKRRAEAALRRQNLALAALHDTTLAIMNRLELSGLLESLVSHAVGLLGTRHGFLYLVNADGALLECKVWLGDRPRDLRAAPNEGVVGRVWKEGRPLVVEDYDLWEGRSPQVPREVFGSMAAAPLVSAGRVAGVLGLAHTYGSGQRLVESDLQLLSAFAQLASIALENARLFRAETVAREQAERLLSAARVLSGTLDIEQVLARILSELEQVVAFDAASIQTLKGESLEIAALRGPDGLEALLGTRIDLSSAHPNRDVIKGGVPVILEDAPRLYPAFARGLHPRARTRSWLGVPLVFGNRVIGMLAMDKADTGFYTAEHARLASAFAAQAAIAIENAALHAATRSELAERRRAEEALRSSEERFRQLAENIDSAFFMLSTDSRMIYASPAYERIWGHPRDALYADASALWDTVHPGDREAFLAYARRQPQGEAIEFRIVRPDGMERWVRARFFPVRDAKGVLQRIAGIAEDVTERRRIEDLRDDVTHTMVHDLRNPLTVTKAFLDWLQTSPPGTVPSAAMLGASVRSTDRVLRLIDGIMDLTRLEGGAVPVSCIATPVRGLVSEVLGVESALAQARSQQLMNDVPVALPAAWADPVLLARVLQNLIGNAIKFTPVGGTIRVGAQRDGGVPMLRIDVDDTGPGIPPEISERLFSKFVTGPQPEHGSGLGLAFCRAAVEAQGGRLWVESRPAEGTTFSFTLPVAGA